MVGLAWARKKCPLTQEPLVSVMTASARCFSTRNPEDSTTGIAGMGYRRLDGISVPVAGHDLRPDNRSVERRCPIFLRYGRVRIGPIKEGTPVAPRSERSSL